MTALRITPRAREERAARRVTNRERRQALETALRLLSTVEAILADLDAIDGDPDFEDGHDREAYTEDEGAVTGDDEPWLNPPTGNGSFDFHDMEIDRVGTERDAADFDQRRSVGVYG